MIVFFSNLDTDLLALAAALRQLTSEMVASISAARLGTTSPELPDAPIAMVVVRLLGGRRAAPGLDGLAATCRQRGLPLAIAAADRASQAEADALSTAPREALQRIRAYLDASNPARLAALLHALVAGRVESAPDPPPVPEFGVYDPPNRAGTGFSASDWDDCPLPAGTPGDREAVDRTGTRRPAAAILFYRSHYLAGNTEFVDALAGALAAKGIRPLAIYSPSLRGDVFDRLVATHLRPNGTTVVDCIVTTMSFAAGTLLASEQDALASPETDTAVRLFQALDVPVLQAIPATVSRQTWRDSTLGLTPVDTAMSVVLPEIDGRIITVPVSFKEALDEPLLAGATLYRYAPDPDRCAQVASQAAALIRLGRTPRSARRVAILFNNYPSSNGRIGNGVGLDTAASAVALLRALATAGYDLGTGDLPADGDALMHRLIVSGTWDTRFQGAPAPAPRPGRLLRSARHEVTSEARWPGLRFGNVLVGVQPPRGHDVDPARIYHDPELPPPPEYVAYYRWLAAAEGFGAHAVIHLGKHGTLEWLPGKAVGLSATCAPEHVLGSLPNVYPFAVNNPGEGAQAKRRSHAVIVDHLPPPLTQAGPVPEAQAIGALLDERGAALSLSPNRLPVIHARLWEAIQAYHLDEDLALAGKPESDDAWRPVVGRLERYLADIGGAPIRDGLHVLGAMPQGETLIDMLFALARTGAPGRPGLEAAVARALDITADADRSSRRLADTTARAMLTALAAQGFQPGAIPGIVTGALGKPAGEPGWPPSLPDAQADVAAALHAIATRAWPVLARTQDEIEHVLRALDGSYVPAGPAGAPSRGMLHCLPTGRNFYTVDPRRLPSETAWQTGLALAESLLRRHQADTGRLPRTVGLVLWGSANMRTQGEDVAEALALLGIRPRWQAGRVAGLETLPLETLGRPRIDVVLRISGLFRDAFSNLVELLDDAITLAAEQDEPPEWNYVRAADAVDAAGGGNSNGNAKGRTPRIFGSKPGTYGTGLLPLLHQGNWRDARDIAAVYETWSAYTYGRANGGTLDRSAFSRRFAAIDVAAKNQDNREHDILDSDDYFQFHGGMVAAVRTLRRRVSGAEELVRAYIGDTSDPGRVVQRSLQEETRRVVRSRAGNPRWIAAAMRHGYRGAAEMAATVDYFFGYDATAGTGAPWMYETLAQRYVLDPATHRFFASKNPWALHETAGRLLEAIQRGLWPADPMTVERLTAVYLETEDALEEGIDLGR